MDRDIYFLFLPPSHAHTHSTQFLLLLHHHHSIQCKSDIKLYGDLIYKNVDEWPCERITLSNYSRIYSQNVFY